MIDFGNSRKPKPVLTPEEAKDVEGLFVSENLAGRAPRADVSILGLPPRPDPFAPQQPAQFGDFIQPGSPGSQSRPPTRVTNAADYLRPSDFVATGPTPAPVVAPTMPVAGAPVQPGSPTSFSTKPYGNAVDRGIANPSMQLSQAPRQAPGYQPPLAGNTQSPALVSQLMSEPTREERVAKFQAERASQKSAQQSRARQRSQGGTQELPSNDIRRPAPYRNLGIWSPSKTKVPTGTTRGGRQTFATVEGPLQQVTGPFSGQGLGIYTPPEPTYTGPEKPREFEVTKYTDMEGNEWEQDLDKGTRQKFGKPRLTRPYSPEFTPPEDYPDLTTGKTMSAPREKRTGKIRPDLAVLSTNQRPIDVVTGKDPAGNTRAVHVYKDNPNQAIDPSEQKLLNEIRTWKESAPTLDTTAVVNGKEYKYKVPLDRNNKPMHDKRVVVSSRWLPEYMPRTKVRTDVNGNTVLYLVYPYDYEFRAERGMDPKGAETPIAVLDGPRAAMQRKLEEEPRLQATVRQATLMVERAHEDAVRASKTAEADVKDRNERNASIDAINAVATLFNEEDSPEIFAYLRTLSGASKEPGGGKIVMDGIRLLLTREKKDTGGLSLF